MLYSTLYPTVPTIKKQKETLFNQFLQIQKITKPKRKIFSWQDIYTESYLIILQNLLMDSCKESQNWVGQSNHPPRLTHRKNWLLPGLEGQTPRSLLNPKPKHELKPEFWDSCVEREQTQGNSRGAIPHQVNGVLQESHQCPLKSSTGIRPVLKSAKRNASSTCMCSKSAEGPSWCHACQGWVPDEDLGAASPLPWYGHPYAGMMDARARPTYGDSNRRAAHDTDKQNGGSRGDTRCGCRTGGQEDRAQPRWLHPAPLLKTSTSLSIHYCKTGLCRSLGEKVSLSGQRETGGMWGKQPRKGIKPEKLLASLHINKASSADGIAGVLK